MAEAFREQQESADLQQLSFEERFGLLIDRRWSWRRNRALERRLHQGRLKGPACIEDIDFRTPGGLDRRTVGSLTQDSAWVREHQQLFPIGPTGIGKTWLAHAFGQKARRDGYTTLFLKAVELFRNLATARADGSHPKLLYQLGRVDLLIVDDFLMAPMNDAERRDFLGDLRHALSNALYTAHLAVARRQLARPDRRSNPRRFHPRPARAQRSPHRTARRIDAQKARPQTQKGNPMTDREPNGFYRAKRSKGPQSPPPRPTPYSPLRGRKVD